LAAMPTSVVEGVSNLSAKLRKYYRFSGSELGGLIITILCLSLIIGAGFDTGAEFDFSLWLFNLFNSMIIVTLSLLVHETAHRLYALAIGYAVETEIFLYGLLGGIVLSIMTYGKLPFLPAGTIRVKMLEGQRLGYFRYHLNVFSIGIIALMGPLSNLVLAIFFKALSFIQGPLIEKAIFINIVLAVTNILPLPFMDGGSVMYGSRPLYALTAGMIVSCSLLIFFTPVLIAVLGSLALGIGCLMIYFFVSGEFL